tara:strand:- start:2715 stop:2927 length:213 start_codon:yes stop_codon:yes gene_type:complete
MSNNDEHKKELLKKYNNLKKEHRDLDKILIKLQEKQTIDLLQIQKLKKKKLILKDKITLIRNKIEPDIIA